MSEIVKTLTNIGGMKYYTKDGTLKKNENILGKAIKWATEMENTL